MRVISKKMIFQPVLCRCLTHWRRSATVTTLRSSAGIEIYDWARLVPYLKEKHSDSVSPNLEGYIAVSRGRTRLAGGQTSSSICHDFEFTSEFQPSSTKFWPRLNQGENQPNSSSTGKSQNIIISAQTHASHYFNYNLIILNEIFFVRRAGRTINSYFYEKWLNIKTD